MSATPCRLVKASQICIRVTNIEISRQAPENYRAEGPIAVEPPAHGAPLPCAGYPVARRQREFRELVCRVRPCCIALVTESIAVSGCLFGVDVSRCPRPAEFRASAGTPTTRRPEQPEGQAP